MGNSGVVGAALENSTSYSGLIADGHHVDWTTLRIAMQTRPIDRFMLVTDAMPSVGSDTKTFLLNGKRIRVENGVCIDNNGTLAGSDLDMATAVRNTVTHIGRTLPEAAFMAATAPADFLGVGNTQGRLLVGQRADIVWMNSELQVMQTFIGSARE